MDIYNAARRLGQPLTVHPRTLGRELPIDAHGVIGDGSTCALVRMDGAIDWLCLPRSDSPSVFAEILDADAGFCAVTPTDRPFESLQRYDPETNVLETLFTIPGRGVLRLTDFMPWTGDPRAQTHQVHRRIECVEGVVDVHVVFDPRFDYGRKDATFEHNAYGVRASGPQGASLIAVIDNEDAWEPRPQGGLHKRIRMKAGQRHWLVLNWGANAAERIEAYRPWVHLRRTRRYWRNWAQNLDYDGPWRHEVLRSALLLKLLIHAPTGAMIAAPTTSLPEWLGGIRNWDYRYTWARDAALGIQALHRLGCQDETRNFFQFMRDVLELGRGFELMVSIDGTPAPDEQTLDHLAGYRDSAPVRIGNGAKDQLQLDSGGYVLDAALQFERAGGALSLRVWRHLVELVEALRKSWKYPDHGIWEPRGGKHHNVHSKLMSWVTFDRASQLAPLFGANELAQAWQACADDVRDDIMASGRSKSGEHFVSQYGGASMDATLLLLPSYGFLPGNDPRVIATVEQVQSKLQRNGYVYRYRIDDGLAGEEGAFVLCGFWLAEALAQIGRIDEAREVFSQHLDAANHVGLLAEEVAPTNGESLGNFPQGFSHMGLINAALRIDRALRRSERTDVQTHRFDRVRWED